MYYSQEVVSEVCRSNDIVDVVSSYVKLQKKGSNYFGLCPFHSEKSPSFSVSQGKQMFHCFGCGVGGSVITFVMSMENYSFKEALEYLADRSGIKLPDVSSDKEEREKESLRSRLLAVNKEAGKFYFYQLRQESGRLAYDYLSKRGLSKETIHAFGLGYARSNKGSLYGYLKKKGFDDPLLKQSGLFVTNEKNGFMDKFWNRVIFPIMDIHNHIIGFGGRVMGKAEPKYLNSPETPIFEKGRNLYGLNIARKSRKKNLIICEGYMDVISMHQAGFDQTVASLGTALTMAQANLMKRYSEEVLVCYDSDEAGIKAALRAIPIFRDAGLKCRVINLLPYKDPDEFIKNLGASKFEERMSEAENSFYYEVRMDERNFDLKDPHDKTQFYKNIAIRLLRFEDAIERDNYLEGVAKKYSISPDSLMEMVKKQAMVAENIRVYERPKQFESQRQGDSGSIMAQKNILTWICEEKEIYPIVRQYIKTEDFTQGIYRDIAGAIFEQCDGDSLNPAAIISMYEEEKEQRQVASILNENIADPDDDLDRDRVLKDLILRILNDSYVERARSNEAKDPLVFQRMLDKKKELDKIRREFDEKRLLS
ncbi:MAG: DNA primase [Lachnospiraceae bacterium]|nr:DNA primase [Lachnospiraceae bacterium]